MKVIARLACVAGCILLTGAAVADQGLYPKTDDEKNAAIDALNWLSEPKSYTLDASHAHVRPPAGAILLLGSDAQRYAWLVSGVEFPDTEAVLRQESDGADVYYEWRAEGHVDDSDWSDVDPDQLLSQYNEAINADRERYSVEPVQILRWLRPPTYDVASRTVTFAVELKDAENHWANVVALRLGRGGYTEFTWVGSITSIQSSGNDPQLLRDALNGHEFDQGHRYADFREGEEVATYSIAELLEAKFEAKRGEGPSLGILGAITVPAVLVFAYVAYELRQLFPRNRANS